LSAAEVIGAAQGAFMEAKDTTEDAIRSSRALVALAALAIGALLYFAHAVFIPVILALLLSLILSTAVEALRRIGLPRAVSAFILMAIILGSVGGVVDVLIEPAQQWFINAPRTLQAVEKKIRPLEKIIQRVEGLTQRAGQLAGPQPNSPAAAPQAAAASTSATGVMAATGSTLASTLTVVILTLFLLSGGPPMLAKMTAALGSNLQAAHVLKVIEAIRIELGRYYGTITLINLGLALATALVMQGLGVPNPFLWGAIAGILNFIPYVGSATTLLLLAIVALVSFNDLGRVFAVVGSYLALATIEGQVVQPLLVGRRLDLNPILVFLAVWFGGWFWGVAGIVIAVPVLAALKVAASYSEYSAPIVEFLSPTGSETVNSLRDRVSALRSRPNPGSRAEAKS
jgi:predicted PurR-regulated permease PerM